MLFTNKILNVEYSRYIKLQSNLRKKRRECVIFLDHTSTITAGVNAERKNLLVSRELLDREGINLAEVSRGGDFTAHEPGQLVIYPHIDLKKRNLSIGEYLNILLSTVEKLILKVYKLEVIQRKDKPGLYLKNDPEKKIASIGVNFKSYFTSFGIAINITNDLKTFSFINPCGEKSENIISIKSIGLDQGMEAEFIGEFKRLFSEKFY